MSILIETLSVVIPRHVLDAGYPGGTEGYLEAASAAPGARYAIRDERLTCVSFAAPTDVKLFTSRLEPLALAGEGGTPAPVACVDEDFGPTAPCPWLRWRRHADGYTSCWLEWTEPGELATPDGWLSPRLRPLTRHAAARSTHHSDIQEPPTRQDMPTPVADARPERDMAPAYVAPVARNAVGPLTPISTPAIVSAASEIGLEDFERRADQGFHGSDSGEVAVMDAPTDEEEGQLPGAHETADALGITAAGWSLPEFEADEVYDEEEPSDPADHPSAELDQPSALAYIPSAAEEHASAEDEPPSVTEGSPSLAGEDASGVEPVAPRLAESVIAVAPLLEIEIPMPVPMDEPFDDGPFDDGIADDPPAIGQATAIEEATIEEAKIEEAAIEEVPVMEAADDADAEGASDYELSTHLHAVEQSPRSTPTPPSATSPMTATAPETELFPGQGGASTTPAPLSSVVAHLVDRGWRFSQDSEQPAVFYQVVGSRASYPGFAAASEEAGLVRLYVELPTRVPEHRHAAAVELITRANHELPLGNFEFDYGSGEVRFRAVADSAEGCFSAAAAGRLLQHALDACDRYHDPLMQVIYGGLSPAEAIG